jgi:acetate kinase
MNPNDPLHLLIANVGSTSLKFKVYEFPSEKVLAEGKIEAIGRPRSPASYRNFCGQTAACDQAVADYPAAIRLAVGWLTDPAIGVLASLDQLDAVGFKTVHGGPFSGVVRLDERVLQGMRDFAGVAPLHNPIYLTAIGFFREVLPNVPFYGLFETTFHQTIPPEAHSYAIPKAWREQLGIRRYGFHGASHWFISERVPQLLGRPAGGLRIISCHLGGSSSLCAIRDGRSVDTTMGFSPQSGVPQSARNGELDPFVVLYLIESRGFTPEQVRRALCDDSGLKGLSGGLSGDVPPLEAAAAQGNADARLALDCFVYEVAKHIGALWVACGGCDVLVFTGGIGERGAAIRSRICERLACLGVRLDAQRNAAPSGEATISTADSTARVMIVPTNEEIIVARRIAEKIQEQC